MLRKEVVATIPSRPLPPTVAKKWVGDGEGRIGLSVESVLAREKELTAEFYVGLMSTFPAMSSNECLLPIGRPGPCAKVGKQL